MDSRFRGNDERMVAGMTNGGRLSLSATVERPWREASAARLPKPQCRTLACRFAMWEPILLFLLRVGVP